MWKLFASVGEKFGALFDGLLTQWMDIGDRDEEDNEPKPPRENRLAMA